MAFMASCSFIHMNVKEFKSKIYLMNFNLGFDLQPLKVNTYGMRQESIHHTKTWQI
jgi:hypothetical protein